MPGDPESAAEWGRCSWWVPHAVEIATGYAAAEDPEQAATLLLVAARYLTARAIYPAARAAAEQALDCGLAAWAAGDPRLGPLHSQLGLILEHLGNLDAARRRQEQALVLLERGGDRRSPLMATLLMRLGRVLCCQRDLVPAIRSYERALAVLAHVDAPLEEGRCLTDLALATWMSGHPEQALAIFDRALALLDDRVGADHPDAAHARSGRAVVLQDLGHVEQAYALQSEAAAVLVACCGERHPDVAHALDKLGYMAGLLGRWQESIDRHRRAMTILADVHGADHVEVAMPLSNLGVMHLAAGDLDAAAEAQLRARTLFAYSFGTRHPHTALATRRLGLVRMAQGRHGEGQELLQAALTDTVAGLGADHPDAAAIGRELADCAAARSTEPAALAVPTHGET